MRSSRCVEPLRWLIPVVDLARLRFTAKDLAIEVLSRPAADRPAWWSRWVTEELAVHALKTGRPSKAERDQHLRQSVEDARRSGLTKDDAIEAVAAVEGMTAGRVHRIVSTKET